ncbi:hypothetical protein RD792_003369 [Penstemon davidsonii]|uniref:Transposase n=1 Tax=Penstemon davidsonii TaxID=160366 RepID=A0ABR0DTM4_9LAMI|nr:hypothetical protein RD792_003369 [Penstemon davidsonii]
MPPPAGIGAQGDRIPMVVPAMVKQPQPPMLAELNEAFAKDAIIAWFRGEFAAANAIIDSLCGHLRQLDGGEPAAYQSAFAAIHRRRLNWIPILQMQKYYSIADVTTELKKVAEKKREESDVDAKKVNEEEVREKNLESSVVDEDITADESIDSEITDTAAAAATSFSSRRRCRLLLIPQPLPLPLPPPPAAAAASSSSSHRRCRLFVQIQRLRMSMFYSEYDNSDLHHFVDPSDDNGEHENEEPNDDLKRRMAWDNNTGTSSLLRHIENSCPNFKLLTSRGRRAKGLTEFKFDQMKSRKDFATAVIKHNYPFNMVEHKYFKVFLDGLNPNFDLHSRNTLRADVIEIYEEEKLKIANMLNDLTSKVSLTTDMWTSDHSRDPYCCLTVHYIDEDWKLNNKVIAFKKIPHPHDGTTLFEFVKEMLLLWNLDKKLCSVVVDNATANDSMIKKLKDWLCDAYIPFNEKLLHVRCSAHVLNLIVQDGLCQVTGLIENIRATVRYLNKSPAAEQKFESAKKHCKLEDKRSIAMDVANRWNSTYELLETALPLRDAFSRLSLMDNKYHHNPSNLEWKTAQIVMECLQAFYDATCHFSGRKYPTSNVFFPDVCEIKVKLMEWRDSEIGLLKEMSGPMQEKFDKYWDECSLVLAVAVVFDPRFKMQIVEYFYGEIYGSNALPYIQRVRNSLDDLFFSYGGNINSSSNEVGTSSNFIVEKRTKLSGFDRWCDKSRISSAVKKSELDTYLDEDRYPRARGVDTFNVLDWWKLNSLRLPILGKISRDILVVPATTVASESAFSVGGRLVDESRACLLPDVVETLIGETDLID